MIRKALPVLLWCCSAASVTAQDLPALRKDIDTLCTPYFAGRGYTADGMAKAANWLAARFSALGLKTFGTAYRQPYTFPVNTFPGVMSLQLDGRTITPGSGFLVLPGSKGAVGKDLRVTAVSLSKIKSEKDWLDKTAEMQNRKGIAFFLQNMETLQQATRKSRIQLLNSLGRGIYLLPETGSPLWSVATDTLPATIVQLYDSLAPQRQPRRLSLHIENKFVPEFTAANIAGYVPGTERPDSFIVITAHYDHLGTMGRDALFPGASDNASGTAMLLALAHFYAAHPGRYSIAFILFGGEEAGLQGSLYYTEHPLFPLAQIRFLLNLDIMGDASKGITVVNATAHPEAFAHLEQLNRMDEPGGRTYVPEVQARSNAANSDHYPFSQKGVPAIFIYSRGGKGFYHDTNDQASSLSLENIPALSTLLKRFIGTLQQGE